MSRRTSRLVPKSGKEVVKGRPSASLRAAAAPSPQAEFAQRSRAQTRAQWLLPLLLIGIGLAAYYNSFEGAFLLDDGLRIAGNPQIRSPGDLWGAMVQSSRPIVQVSLALNYAIGGVNPWGYHAFNLAVHILAGLLLFGIVRRMLESDDLRARYGGVSRWLAAAAAGIWLAHPLQTESVTYIIQRAESMMGLFFLLTLYCGIRACQSPDPHGWGIAAVLACALGMGSKEVMVSAPILMWLYDRLFISRTTSETFRRHWGLYAGLAATWIVLGALQATSRAEEQESVVVGLNSWNYALTQCEVIVHYLRLAVWPNPLVFDYAWPIAKPLSSVVPSAAALLALSGATVLALRRRVWMGFWGAWFFLTLAPTSSVLPIADIAFEHRMYLPLAAVVTVLVVAGHDLMAFFVHRVRASENARRWLEAGVVSAAVLALGFATVRRNDDYGSAVSMWSDTVAKRPDNPRARNNLGVALTKEGRTGEAMAQYAEAVRLKPDHMNARNNLGDAFFKQGRTEEAIAQFKEAVRARPTFAASHTNLGSALMRAGRNDEAIEEFFQAASLDPSSSRTHNDLGTALYFQGRIKEAIAQYSAAVRLQPGFAEAHNNLGLGLLKQGNTEGAIVHFSEAARLDPTFAQARKNLQDAKARR